jgi:hypothetical protein
VRPEVTREEIDSLIAMRCALDAMAAEYERRLLNMLGRLADAPELCNGHYPDTINEIFRILGKQE